MWRKGNPSPLLLGIQTDAATVENSMESLKKLKMEPSFDLAIPLLGIYPKNPKTPIQNGVSMQISMHPYVHRKELFTIAEIWKHHRHPSIDEWIKKLSYIYIMEYYTIVKKGILTFCNGTEDYYAK